MEHFRLYHQEIPPFLTDCLRVPALRRLAGVGMNCGCEYTSFPRFRGLAPYSRLDHSIGVGLIVWHFTGDRRQAVAGLLHDIATPVFAHTVDFLHGDHLLQVSTEEGTEAMIASSGELRDVLRGHGLTVGDVCDHHLYPICDNDPPRLSADRLEYTAGNCLNYGICDPDAVRIMYDDLAAGTAEDGQPELVFRSREQAERFALAALRCSEIYASDEDRYAMQHLADLLDEAIRRGILTETDLHATEPRVIAKLKSDEDTAARWERFRALRRVESAVLPGPRGEWRRIAAKKRYIDPLVQGYGRASALFPGFARELEAFLHRPQTAWLLGGA